MRLEHRQADNLPSHRGRRQSALIFTPRMVPGMLYPTKHALSTCGTPASCGGKRVLEALNSSSVCYVTVLVYIPYILFSYSPYTGGAHHLNTYPGKFPGASPRGTSRIHTLPSRPSLLLGTLARNTRLCCSISLGRVIHHPTIYPSTFRIYTLLSKAGSILPVGLPCFVQLLTLSGGESS